MHRIVSTEDWLDARRELLEEEKSFQKARDALAEKRRELPWREVPDYEFQTEDGVRRLSELFDNCSQLMIYHFMYGPEWDAGCPSCSFWADSYDRTVPHLKARDVSLIAVSRAPLEKLLAYRERMGWTFPWVSSANSDFNFDFGVSFSREQIEAGSASYNYRPMQGKMEELPGLSAFKKQNGDLYHTYSTYARGLDPFNAAYQLLDAAPDGRTEDELDYPQAWVKRRDEY